MGTALTPQFQVENCQTSISPEAWVVCQQESALPFPQLNWTHDHEETDDKMLFHMQNILSTQSGPTSIAVSAGDKDVLFESQWSTREILASNSTDGRNAPGQVSETIHRALVLQ